MDEYGEQRDMAIDEIDDLRSQLEQAESDAEELSRSLAAAQQRVRELENANRCLNENIDGLLKNREALKELRAEKNQLFSRVRELESENSLLRARPPMERVRELEADNARLRAHVAELEKDNEIIKASEVEAHDENRRLMAEVERLRQCHSTTPPPAQCYPTPEK